MKPFYCLPAFALLVLLGGCIVSEQPLGEDVAVLKPEEWNGVWLVSGNNAEQDELIRVSVIDAAMGLLSVHKDAASCDSSTETFPLRVRQSGAWLFFHSADVRNFYNAGSATLRAGNKLLAYAFSQSRVEELVEQGSLPGRMERERVILGPMTREHYDALLRGGRPAWGGEPALVAVKLPDKLDPCR